MRTACLRSQVADVALELRYLKAYTLFSFATPSLESST